MTPRLKIAYDKEIVGKLMGKLSLKNRHEVPKIEKIILNMGLGEDASDGKKLKACLEDINKAEELDKLLQPLHTSLFIESNPSPVKYAASLLGMCNPSVRLPLVEIKDETKKKVSDALKVAKLL